LTAANGSVDRAALLHAVGRLARVVATTRPGRTTAVTATGTVTMTVTAATPATARAAPIAIGTVMSRTTVTVTSATVARTARMGTTGSPSTAPTGRPTTTSMSPNERILLGKPLLNRDSFRVLAVRLSLMHFRRSLSSLLWWITDVGRLLGVQPSQARYPCSSLRPPNVRSRLDLSIIHSNSKHTAGTSETANPGDSGT
jgi:hypothetical protein